MNIKKSAIPIGIFAFAVLAASAFTFVHLSQAQTGNNQGVPGKMFGMWRHSQPAATGTVSSINGNSIQLTGANNTAYTVDASGASIVKFVNNAKTTIQVSGITTGDTLTVFGSVNGSNVTAKQIIDGTLPPRPARTPPAASGTISA